MKSTAFHCVECGNRLVVSLDDPTADCKNCGATVDVPGFEPGKSARESGRKGPELADLGKSKGKASRRPRGGQTSRRQPARSGAGGAKGGIPPMAIAIPLVALVLAVVGMIALSGGGGDGPGGDSTVVDTPRKLTRGAVEDFLRGCKEEYREYLDSLTDGQRKDIASRLRAKAREHFAPSGMDKVMVDEVVSEWVAAREKEISPDYGELSGDGSGSALAAANGGDTGDGGDDGLADGGDDGHDGGDDDGGDDGGGEDGAMGVKPTPSVEAVRLYLDTQPAKRKLLEAWTNEIRKSGDQTRWREHAEVAELQLRRAAGRRFEGVQRDALNERVRTVLAGWREALKAQLKQTTTQAKPGAWVAPKVLGKSGTGDWKANGNVLVGTAPANSRFCAVFLSPQNWPNMEFVCEIKQTGGATGSGLFVRGMTAGGQLSNFFQTAKVDPKPDTWYTVRVITRGQDIGVEITGPGIETARFRSRNGERVKCAFGFVVHGGAKVELRKMKVRQIPPK